MSADEWDADDFEPQATPQAPTTVASDKWEGEDEGEEVKDTWDADDDDEDKKSGTGSDSGKETALKAVQRKKKKPLAERIAEKEAARVAAEQKEKEEQAKTKQMTAEERAAEQERLKKVQEESDLKLAREAFGVDAAGVDSMFPVTEEEFVKFKDVVKNKISSFSASNCYGNFLDKLIQELVIDMDPEDIKKIATNTSSIYREKQRLQKETEKKKKKKTKGVIRSERANDYGDLAASGHGDDDFDDEDYI